MSGVPDECVYRRAPRIVWRLVGESVLTQFIDGHPEQAATELTGWAAFVWVALDEPAPFGVLRERLDARGADIDEALGQLVAAGIVLAR